MIVALVMIILLTILSTVTYIKDLIVKHQKPIGLVIAAGGLLISMPLGLFSFFGFISEGEFLPLLCVSCLAFGSWKLMEKCDY
jgi:Na+-transporting NADH:ubiquinone oxidoreductase subunit NqrE